jgi:hypothetical protein
VRIGHVIYVWRRFYMLMIYYWKLKMVKCEKNCVWNSAPCHLLHMDDQVDPSLPITLASLSCMSCGESQGATTMLIYHYCSKGWHMGYLTPPFVKVPTRDWVLFIMHQIDMLCHFVFNFNIRIWKYSWFKERCNLVENKKL